MSPRRYKLEVTLDEQTHHQLRQLQDLLAHQIANGDPAAIVKRALELLLVETLKKKTGLTKMRRAQNISRAESAPPSQPVSTPRGESAPSGPSMSTPPRPVQAKEPCRRPAQAPGVGARRRPLRRAPPPVQRVREPVQRYQFGAAMPAATRSAASGANRSMAREAGTTLGASGGRPSQMTS